MGIYIPNMEKPERGEVIAFDGENAVYTDDDLKVHRYPIIEIDEPNGILAHDIRKVIAFIDPHMIIATTYDEQIERAKAVKDWLMGIVGERGNDE